MSKISIAIIRGYRRFSTIIGTVWRRLRETNSARIYIHSGYYPPKDDGFSSNRSIESIRMHYRTYWELR